VPFFIKVLFIVNFSGRHFEKGTIVQAVHWYLSYALSYRGMAELLLERGVRVWYLAINRWVVKTAPLCADEFKMRRWKPGSRWRLVETSTRVRGQWKYRYRAVDSDANTIDCLLTVKRDRKAAQMTNGQRRAADHLPVHRPLEVLTT